jgi:hypothetical protein
MARPDTASGLCAHVWRHAKDCVTCLCAWGEIRFLHDYVCRRCDAEQKSVVAPGGQAEAA